MARSPQILPQEGLDPGPPCWPWRVPAAAAAEENYPHPTSPHHLLGSKAGGTSDWGSQSRMRTPQQPGAGKANMEPVCLWLSARSSPRTALSFRQGLVP